MHGTICSVPLYSIDGIILSMYIYIKTEHIDWSVAIAQLLSYLQRLKFNNRQLTIQK